MINNIFILGAGGMAREVYNILERLHKHKFVIGFIVNEKQQEDTQIKGLPVNFIKNNKDLDKRAQYISGIGSPLRNKWIKNLELNGFKFGSAISPDAVIRKNVQLGHDVVVFTNDFLGDNLVVKDHVFISANSNIGHDGLIEEYVTIAPGVNIGGRSKIGKGTFIGIGTTITNGADIGSNVFIGAGSVVVNDIPDNCLAYGNPARPVKKMTEELWEKFL